MARKSRKAVNQVILPAAPSEKIYRAGLYARISVETERKREADTIGNQIQLLKDFASENLDIDVVDIYVDDVLYTYDYVFMDLEALNSSLFDHDFVTALRAGTNAFDAAALVFAAPGSRPPVALLDSRDQQGAKNSAVDAYSKMFESFTGWFGVSFDSFSITDDVSGRVAMPRSPVVK